MVDFALTEEQRMVQETAREFAQETVKPLAEEANEKDDPEDVFTTMKPAYEEAFELGFAFPYVPGEYGGGFQEEAIDHLTFAIAVEEVCAADPGFGCTLLVNTLGQLPVYMFGSDEQKERFLGETVEAMEEGNSDYIWGYVISEPPGKPGGTASFDAPGAYPTGQQLTAEYDEEAGEYVLNGEKFWPSNAGGWDLEGADKSVFLVRTDRDTGGKGGLSAIIVPRETEGIEYHYIDKIGQRTNQNMTIYCDNARVPEENLLAEGLGHYLVMKAFSWSGPIAAAAAVGCARAAFDYVMDWSKEYTAGASTPIYEFQAPGYMMFDAASKIEASRYLYWKMADYMDKQGVAGGIERHEDLNAGSVLAGSLAKVRATEVCRDVIYECMQVMGVNSIDESHPLNRIYQDAITLPLYDAGNVGIQRRKAWGVMGDEGFDSTLIMEDRGLKYKDSMVGWGTESGAPADYREERMDRVEPDTEEAGTD